MVDSGGPGVNVKACTTTGLADLGDTTGFATPGKEGQLYAFELAEGVYKRKEISVNGGAQTFGELSDVDLGSPVRNKPYQFILNDSNVWVPYRDQIEGGWDIDIKVQQPYVRIGKNHEFKKLQNSGNLLCSYITRHNNLVVKSTDFGHVVGMKGKIKKGTLRLHKEFDFGQPAKNSVIILEVILGDAPDDFMEIIKGLQIKWSEQDANKPLLIYIKTPATIGMDSTIRFSIHGIVPKPELFPQLTYDFIYIGAVDFKRIRYTKIPLPIEHVRLV